MAPRNAIRPPHFKLVTLGESGVGKTSIVRRLCENRFFTVHYETVGVDYGMTRLLIDDREVKLHFFDLAGSPEFSQVRNEFYKDIHGLILVYDSQFPNTSHNLENWIKEFSLFSSQVDKFPVIAVCANKMDSLGSSCNDDGKIWASQHGFRHFEVSALTGNGIQEAFQSIGSSILKEYMCQQKT